MTISENAPVMLSIHNAILGMRKIFGKPNEDRNERKKKYMKNYWKTENRRQTNLIAILHIILRRKEILFSISVPISN